METARSAARDYAGFPGRQPKLFHDNVASEQAAKRPTIETGLNLQSEIVDAKQYEKHIVEKRRGIEGTMRAALFRGRENK